MSGHRFQIRRAAVLGAGVMGAQIAAHLANANIPTLLFDLKSEGADSNTLVNKSLAGLKKLKPTPWVSEDKQNGVLACHYEADLSQLAECDLVIEAIGERLDWKLALYRQVGPVLKSTVIFASNTSGLSIEKLAEALPPAIQGRFCGVHFFNPPRYMRLVELTAGRKTEEIVLTGLETFLTSVLGKGVIRSRDIPNFIANRVGIFSMLATLHHAERYAIPLEVVDALTGSLIGRAKSATLRTADVVGLDTFAFATQTLADNLPEDPWHAFYTIPAWMQQLIQVGVLGQKTKKGVYQKQGNDIHVWDVASGQYRAATQTPNSDVLALLKEKNPVQRFEKLRQHAHPEAQFLWACYRDLFHYCAVHAATIAETVRDIDLAIRWGFGWQQGPFEIWQSAGWSQIRSALEEAISQKTTLVATPLPEWTRFVEAVFEAKGAYHPERKIYVPRSSLPVYQRQYFPDPVLGEVFDEGETIFETDAVRCWHQGDDIAILSFKSKQNTVSGAVLDGVLEAVARAEKDYQALVLWQRHGNHFSLGANLMEFADAVAKGNLVALEQAVAKFQQASRSLRYSQIPTIAAVKGMALGGGCELLLHCDRVVAHVESYIGLVESGVGLIPAGGGCKEMALRAMQWDKTNNPTAILRRFFEQIAKAEVSSSAHDALARGYLRESDVIVFHMDELLYVAKQQALCWANSGYRPPLPPPIKVLGEAGIATFKMYLVNWREGGFISEYDYLLASKLAEVLCGAAVTAGSVVDEAWLLRLEREHFVDLARREQTQARIQYTLKNGKPLRN